MVTFGAIEDSLGVGRFWLAVWLHVPGIRRGGLSDDALTTSVRWQTDVTVDIVESCCGCYLGPSSYTSCIGRHVEARGRSQMATIVIEQ